MIMDSPQSHSVVCDCCARIGGRPPTVARYMWITPVGNRIPLCVRCCALWRQNAVEDPDLMAIRIYEVQ